VVARLVAATALLALQRLFVQAITLAPETAHPQAGKPFAVTLTIRVAGRVGRLEHVSPPSFFGAAMLAEERSLVHTPAGTVYRERLRLLPKSRGPLVFGPAYLDAIDARTGHPERFLSNDLRLQVAGSRSTWRWTLLPIACFPIALGLAMRSRRRPNVSAKSPDDLLTEVAAPTPLDDCRWRRDRPSVTTLHDAARVAMPAHLLAALRRTIVGQEDVLEGLLLALIAGGHALLEGPPGVGKTLACRTLAGVLDGSFKRIQFTPDLLPSDVTGMRVFDQRDASFGVETGPIFANLVLADELNRAPAKVHAALLEAMQEGHVTIGPETFALPDPFMVLATMNPPGSDGTYPLPQPQLDRFLLNLRAEFPPPDEELALLERLDDTPIGTIDRVATFEDVRRWRAESRALYMAPEIKRYAVELVAKTRESHPLIAAGASPRATLALASVARAKALLDGRDFVLPGDVRSAALPVLRHRIAFTQRVRLDRIDSDGIIRERIAAAAFP
jgi:MoxR-like ATPase